MTEWISIKDRMPGPWQYVLVAIRVNGESRFEVGHLSDKGNWIVGLCMITGYVTHWMPLPEPPKEE